MINELIPQWEENKHRVRQWVSETPMSQIDYLSIVKAVFRLAIIKTMDGFYEWNHDGVIESEFGAYSGNSVYLIPSHDYNAETIVATHTAYGSCSGCDTILSISRYEDGLPNSEQVDEYMTLALHLVQKLTIITNHD